MSQIFSQEFPCWGTAPSYAFKASYWNCPLQDLLTPLIFFLFFSFLGHICQYSTFPRGLTTVHTLDLPALSWFCSVTILSRQHRSTSLGYTQVTITGDSPILLWLWIGCLLYCYLFFLMYLFLCVLCQKCVTYIFLVISIQVWLFWGKIHEELKPDCAVLFIYIFACVCSYG